MLLENKISYNNYLIKQLPKATAFVTNDFKIIYASDKWETVFDITQKAIEGKSLVQIFNKTLENWKKKPSNPLNDKTTRKSIERYVDSEGNEKWFEWIIIPWFDDQENSIGAILQSEEVTQSVLNESKLKNLSLLLENNSDIANRGIWEYDAVKDTLYWCNTTKKIHEVDNNFIPTIESGIDFYKNGHSRNAISMVFDSAMKDGLSWHEKLQLSTANGNEKWVITTGKPIFKNNKYIGIIGTIEDITVHEKSKNNIRKNEHLLRTLIDNLPLNVFIKDLESNRILVNRSEVEFCGHHDENAVLGKDDFAFFDKETAKKLRDDDLEVMHNLKPIIGKALTHKKKDGSKTSFLTSKIPLIGKEGEVYGLIGFSIDISELKQKENELRSLINVASSQNNKLINFSHIVSHNLRSHTANLSMLLGFLTTEKNELEKQKIVKMLTDASDNLLETLDNLNEVIDINTNTNLEKKSIQLNHKIDQIKENLHAFLINNNAKIINKISNSVTINIVPTYIDNILTSFITNAIKYKSPHRDPIIKLNSKKEGKYTLVSITDNGLGIDLKKNGDKLFGMYKTFHDKKDARGIGLFISKNQIEAMHGKVTVNSKVNQGTTFNIYFNNEK